MLKHWILQVNYSCWSLLFRPICWRLPVLYSLRSWTKLMKVLKIFQPHFLTSVEPVVLHILLSIFWTLETYSQSPSLEILTALTKFSFRGYSSPDRTLDNVSVLLSLLQFRINICYISVRLQRQQSLAGTMPVKGLLHVIFRSIFPVSVILHHWHFTNKFVKSSEACKLIADVSIACASMNP